MDSPAEQVWEFLMNRYFSPETLGEYLETTSGERRETIRARAASVPANELMTGKEPEETVATLTSFMNSKLVFSRFCVTWQTETGQGWREDGRQFPEAFRETIYHTMALFGSDLTLIQGLEKTGRHAEAVEKTKEKFPGLELAEAKRCVRQAKIMSRYLLEQYQVIGLNEAEKEEED